MPGKEGSSPLDKKPEVWYYWERYKMEIGEQYLAKLLRHSFTQGELVAFGHLATNIGGREARQKAMDEMLTRGIRENRSLAKGLVALAKREQGTPPPKSKAKCKCQLTEHPEFGGCCCQCKFRLRAFEHKYFPSEMPLGWVCIAFAFLEGEDVAYVGDFEHGICELFTPRPKAGEQSTATCRVCGMPIKLSPY